MAHELETMAYAGETPWHGLGVEVSNELTPMMMMEKSGCDWTVHERESFIEHNGEKIKTGQKSLVRSTDGKILTNVGENWHPVQNETAFEFFSDFVNSGDMEMHTAGSLKGGEMVWALAKVKESFDLFGGDQVDSYLLFSNPHTYGKSIDIRFTPIRVVCNNTLTMSLEQDVTVGTKLSHRSEFNADTVKETLGLAHEKFGKYRDMAEFLGNKRFTADQLLNYYSEVFPLTSGGDDLPQQATCESLSRMGKAAHDVIETQPGSNFAEGSWWQALNSVTYHTDHVQGRNKDTRLHSQWFGANQQRKIKAAEKAVEYANAA